MQMGGVDCSGMRQYGHLDTGSVSPRPFRLVRQALLVEGIKVGRALPPELSLPASSARPLPGRCPRRSPQSTGRRTSACCVAYIRQRFTKTHYYNRSAEILIAIGGMYWGRLPPRTRA